MSELRTVGFSFSKRKEIPCSEHFGKKWFIYDLAHLAVIFNHMSEIKLSFQVHCGFCFKKNYKVSRISNQLGMPDFEMLEKVLHPQMTDCRFLQKEKSMDNWKLLRIISEVTFILILLKLNHRSTILFFLIYTLLKVLS